MTQYDELCLHAMRYEGHFYFPRYTAELYPTLIRSRAVGCCSVMARYKRSHFEHHYLIFHLTLVPNTITKYLKKQCFQAPSPRIGGAIPAPYIALYLPNVTVAAMPFYVMGSMAGEYLIVAKEVILFLSDPGPIIVYPCQ